MHFTKGTMMIEKTAAVAATAMLLACAAYGQTASTGPANVSSRPAAKPPDLCKGAIDPYDLGQQRKCFLLAAGVDNELTAKEFAADAKKAGGFIRKFDRWEAMAAYDRNANKSIDWFEAKAYRRAMRMKVLAAFDSDKDGRLKGAERDAANRALAAGRVSSATTRPARSFRMFGSDQDRREMLRNYDADGDGRLSREERRTARRAMRERVRARMLERFDADGDGEFNETERQAMREFWRRRGREMRQRWELRRYDADGDGELDENERAEMDKARAERQARMEARRKEWLEKYDADGDGRLSGEERRAAWRAARAEIRRRILERFDADGDGELSEQERDKMRQEFRRRFRPGTGSAED